MGGISSGTGIFSGIDTTSLINQLLAIEARPRALAQQRVLDLQKQQAAYLGLNSKIQALKTAASSFRLNKVFQTNKATSSDDSILTATASTSATPGTYSFIVDRLVSTQQFISRGFADASSTGVNAGSFTFESAAARLDRETSLSDLNGGDGIARGKIVISDSDGHATTVDLSRAATASDVMDAINSAGANVTASVQSGRFVVKSNTAATITIADAFGFTTAESLGIASSTPAGTVTGSQVYTLGRDMSLRSLNDGNGVFVSSAGGQGRYDFAIKVTDGGGTTTVNVNLGDVYDSPTHVATPAVSTLGGAIDRINAALENQFGTQDVQVSLAADGVSLKLEDALGRSVEVVENPTSTTSTTAHDLGLLTSSPQVGVVNGKRLLAGLNSTLARSLNGGQGVSGTGGLDITARDGTVFNLTLDATGSLKDMLAAIGTGTGGKITAALNTKGTGITLTDHSGGGGNLIVGGSSAASLGVATSVAGVAATTVDSGNLQHQYLTVGTLLSSMRSGQGVGTGSFRITDSTGATQTVNVTDSTKTVDDLLKAVNSRGLRVKARVNDKGDGILLYEDAGGGALKIKVEDVTGGVAGALNLKGEAAGTGVQNTIDGTQERTVTFGATDTLQTVASKITSAGIGVAAAVINDGGGTTPFRLTLTAKNSGTAGRFVVDTGSFDLGATQLDAGNDARVFFGSGDPARAVLLTSSQNTLSQVVSGVSIDLSSPSADPVTLTVSRDTDAIETAINTLVTAFNAVTDDIAGKTGYDPDSQTKGILLGDGTVLNVRSRLYSTLQSHATGVVSEFDSWAAIGITVGDGGHLSLNDTKFRAALEEDYEGVADLVGAWAQTPAGPTQVSQGITVSDPNATPTFTKLGLAGLLENVSDSFINSSNGLLTRQNQTLNDQIALQNKRIADFTSQLDARRAVLQQKFLAMEEAIGQLQTQQQALGSIK